MKKFLINLLIVFGGILLLAAMGSEGKEKTARAQEREVGYISPRDRFIISTFLDLEHRAGCPVALQKLPSGCLPDTLPEKDYKLGKKLPSGIIPLPLPSHLAGKLRKLPHGYHYGMLNNDVILISDDTGRVLDAVTTEAALGR